MRGDEAQELTFSQHPGEVWTVAVSSDGKKIASAGLGIETPVKVWDLPPAARASICLATDRSYFAWPGSPDGERIASSGWDGVRQEFAVKVWNARTRKVDFEVARGMETPALSFGREYLATGRSSGAVQVWNANRRGSSPRCPHMTGRCWGSPSATMASTWRRRAPMAW